MADYTDEELVALGRAVIMSTLTVDMMTGTVTVACGPKNRRIVSTGAGSFYSAIFEAAGLVARRG